MSYLVLPLISLLVLLSAGASGLPWLALADRVSGRKRSVFYKSAGQISLLALALQLFLFLTLGFDLLLQGTIDRALDGVWAWVFSILLICLGTSVLCLLVPCLWQRSNNAEHQKSPVITVLIAFSCIFSLLVLSATVLLTWAFLRGLLAQNNLPLAGLLLSSVGISNQLWVFVCYVAGFGFLALSAAFAVVLPAYLLLRKRDDFGRDYYSSVLKRGAGSALWYCLFLLLVAVVTLVLTWNWPLAHLQPVFGLGRPAMNGLYAGLGLALPLAMLCLRGIVAAAQPLRKKTLVWLTLFLLWIWIYAWLGRIWL